MNTGPPITLNIILDCMVELFTKILFGKPKFLAQDCLRSPSKTRRKFMLCPSICKANLDDMILKEFGGKETFTHCL